MAADCRRLPRRQALSGVASGLRSCVPARRTADQKDAPGRARLGRGDLLAASAWLIRISSIATSPCRSATRRPMRSGRSSRSSRAGYVLFFQIRGLAEWVVRAGDWWLFRTISGFPEESRRWIQNLQRPGRLAAALNYYRANVGVIVPQALVEGVGSRHGSLQRRRSLPRRSPDDRHRRRSSTGRGATSASRAPTTGRSSPRRRRSTRCCSTIWAEH